MDFEYVDSIKGRKGHTEANIKDLSFLESWKNLIQLKLYSCTSLTDISALSDKTHLRTLALHSCENITDFTPLYELKNLKLLDLTHSKIPPERIKEIQTAMPWCKVWNEDQKGKVLERKRIPAHR